MENTDIKTPLNRWLAAAGLCMALTTGLHVFGGGPEFYAPLRASTLDPTVVSGYSVIWHAITLILAAFAVALAWLSRHRNAGLFWMVLGLQLGFAALFAIYGLVDLGSLLPLSQWVIFTVIPALMFVGWRRGQRSDLEPTLP